MGKIYSKTVIPSDTNPIKKTLIMSPREYILRDIGDDTWTEVSMGALVSFTPVGNDNGYFGDPRSAAVFDSISAGSLYDRLMFGLKSITNINDPVNEPLPGIGTSSTFVGYSSNQTGVNLNRKAYGSYNYTVSLGDVYSTVYTNTNIDSDINASIWELTNSIGEGLPTKWDLSGSYAAYIGMHISRSVSEGTASYWTYMAYKTGLTPTADNADAMLRSCMSDTGVTRDPESEYRVVHVSVSQSLHQTNPPIGFFLHWPFYGTQIRMHAYGWEKIS